MERKRTLISGHLVFAVISLDDGTYDYTKTSASLQVTGAVDKVIIQFKTRFGTGKFFIDDVTLNYSAGLHCCRCHLLLKPQP